MNKKELLLDQLAACRNEGSWMQPLSIALEGLSSTDAVWRPNAGSHSISEILYHLHHWNERWLKLYLGEKLPPSEESNASTFVHNPFTAAQQWTELVEKLDRGLAEWQQAVEHSSEEKLQERIPDFPEDALWWQALSNLCTHNSYHIGQIIYIRKLQGSWNRKDSAS
ncbi:DinB family protein [Planococcus sp. CAU13]|uniref:DinB family protein n=1 Tax=Planococcus sp. CAU13 TaxID=1541197 RepID=UPI00052FE232|nr:DinB family protein [Planococcus sp. CAU13]